MMQRLQAWRDAGWLRALDRAFAVFIQELDAQAPPSLLLACALLARLEGRGHSCLPLREFRDHPLELLGWPAEAEPELASALRDWPRDTTEALAAWGSCGSLQIDPPDETGTSPLVLAHGRLYLRRYWRHELGVARHVRARTRAVANEPLPDAVRVRAVLARLFEAAPAVDFDWQQAACALALRRPLTLVTGGPGTGKTHTAARLLVLLQALHGGPQPLRIALAAPTGKAATRLRQSMDVALQRLLPAVGEQWPIARWVAELGPARTLHALLGGRPDTRRFMHDAANPLEVDVLFVDEASMVHLEMMAALFEALPPTARVVLLGDKDQLASVEAGAVLGDLCRSPGGYDVETADWLLATTGQRLPPEPAAPGGGLRQQTVTLRHSHRFAGAIRELALAVNRGDGACALELARAGAEGGLALVETRDPGRIVSLAVDGYRSYLATLGQRPADPQGFEAWVRSVLRDFDRFRVLCAVREGPWGVSGINTALEAALVDAGLVPRKSEWYEGRPVMVTRNDASLGVFNGDIGIVLAPPGSSALRAWFGDGERLRSVSVGRLADVETAFALTVHKSQGSEFEHVALVLPDEDSALLTRELVYTGITRARTAFTLVANDGQRLAQAAARLTRRVSGLAALLAPG